MKKGTTIWVYRLQCWPLTDIIAYEIIEHVFYESPLACSGLFADF